MLFKFCRAIKNGSLAISKPNLNKNIRVAI